MKIGCDVCTAATAAVICCADEAALCARCDEKIHATSQLDGKHGRLSLNCDASKIPRCDICQDKPAFILCVEDRALFCQDCDEAIHAINTLLANHQRFLATNILLGLTSTQSLDSINHYYEPSSGNSIAQSSKISTKEQILSGSTSPTWAIATDFHQSCVYEAGYKDSSIGYGELSWFGDSNISSELASESSLNHAKVPEFISSQPRFDETLFRPPNPSMPRKKPRFEIVDDLDSFMVPKIG